MTFDFERDVVDFPVINNLYEFFRPAYQRRETFLRAGLLSMDPWSAAAAYAPAHGGRPGVLLGVEVERGPFRGEHLSEAEKLRRAAYCADRVGW